MNARIQNWRLFARKNTGIFILYLLIPMLIEIRMISLIAIIRFDIDFTEYNTCSIKILLQVAWLRVETQTILTIQHHVITKNHRIGIANTENRMWHLHIKDVREADQGWYMVLKTE